MYEKDVEVGVKGKECAMLITIGILVHINICLESIHATGYSPLPVVVKDNASQEIRQWADAKDARIVSQKEGSYRLRVRVEFRGEQDKDAAKHAAFLINEKSWIDGKDGWLYYRNKLQKNETADAVCKNGYLDRQGANENVYATLLCEWQPANQTG